MKSIGNWLVAATLATLASPAALAAGLLLGEGALNTPGDLTRIQAGAGVLEFLDLTVTMGNSVAGALSTYATTGFHWANRSEVSDLFDAFGIAYASQAGSATTIVATAAQRGSFISYLGSGNTVVGWIDDLTTATLHTDACVSINQACGPEAFTFNTTAFWPANPGIGVYLVRAVPEAPTWAAMVVGLAGLALRMRRRLSAA